MRRLLPLLTCGGLALTLSACTEDGTPTDPLPTPPVSSSRYIRGTVSMPSGVSLGGTEVVACFVVNNQCDANSANTKAQVLQGSGSSASYSFENLAAGQYAVVALKDVNNNNEFDEGDYSGFYNGGTLATAVTPPAQGVNVSLQVKRPETTPSSEAIKFLRPRDFVGGRATVSFTSLGTQERVAVIPVHASQSLGVDGFQYSISASGVTAQNVMPGFEEQGVDTQAQGLQAEEPATVRTGAHLRQLDASLQWTRRLQQAGARPLSGAGRVSLQQTSLGKCPAPYTVGSRQCNFWILLNDSQQQITATLRYSSANAYWFVQNEDASDFSQAELQGLANDFENKVVPVNRQYFGNFSDVDGNGKVFIVFSRLLGPEGLLGYVLPADLYSDAETAPQGIRSNEGDIFYAATPSTLNGMTRSSYFGVTMPSTMVHELKHQIAISTRALSVPERPLEELWIEEGSAMAAQQLANLGSQVNEVQGYARFGLAAPQDYRVVHASRPEGFEEGLGIYGYNFLLIWRAAEKKGHANFWKSWVAGPTSGVANLEFHTGLPFAEQMLDWAPTLMLDDTGLLPGYNYQGFNLRDGSWATLGYGRLGTSATGTARSMSYWVGRGTGGAASVTVQAVNSAQPYAVVMRLPGTLPYSTWNLSGSVSAPTGASLQGSTLVACHVVNGQCNENSFKTKGGTFSTTSQRSNYTLTVEPGDYILYAYKDMNGDGKPNAGDYYGCYGTAIGCSTFRVSSDMTGLNVQMAVRTSLVGDATAALPMWKEPRQVFVDPQPLFQSLFTRAD